MNPWLQRLMIALGAGVATSAAVIGTAKNKYKKARKRRRKKSDPPVVIGTVAKLDAGAAFEAGLSGRQWLQGIKIDGQRFVDFVTRKKKTVVNDDGALEPADIRDADGTRVDGLGVQAQKKLTPAQLRRRRRQQRRGGQGGQRKEATLFESARESLRQVVKEEAAKVIDEKVEASGLKKASDALKSAGEKVGGAMKDAATKVKDGIPEDAQQQVVVGLQSAGKSLLAGAKKLGQSVSQAVAALQAESSLSSSSDALSSDALPSDALPADAPASDAAASAAPASDAVSADALPTDTIAADEAGVGGSVPAVVSSQAGDQAAPAATSVEIHESAAVTPQSRSAEHSEGFSAAEVSDKLQGGVQKLGAFLSGPGNPAYKKSARIGQGGGGDVVEAKDAPSAGEGAPKDPGGS